MTKIVSLAVLVLVNAAAIAAQASPPSAGASRIASLPQDQHEGLIVAADAYKDSDRAKDKFGKANPIPVGILPVEVFLTNQTTEPLRINVETIQLTVHFANGRHQDVDWLSIDEIARAIAHPKGPSNPHAPRLPIGVPTGGDSKTDRIIDVLHPFALDADIIPPMGTIHGFLFFDLSHDMSLADHATLYVPNVTDVPTKKALMFFEVALGK